MIQDIMDFLSQADPEVGASIQKEFDREQHNIELIASENIVSKAVLLAMGTCLTNKYAEGYPGKRYYGGCYAVDVTEELARQRACQLFGCAHANVQPHSGANANLAAFFALLQPGDTVLSMNLAHGGHLSHGSPVNISGKYFRIVPYGVSDDTETIDYEQVMAIAKECRPKLILAGASAYPRTLDFAKFREIADAVGARLMVDMAHIAGLVAAGVHPSPIPYADVVTTTTHKTLRGPRGGMILCNDDDLYKKINSAVFPGTQGGPLEHIIAAKAVCLGEALKPEFRAYGRQVAANAGVLAEKLIEQGFRLVSGGTDNHLILVDTRHFGLTGKEYEHRLDEVGITVNKNTIPNDPEKPFVTSGIRVGTPAVTTRGFREPEMAEIARWMGLMAKEDYADHAEQVRAEVAELCKRFPLYQERKTSAPRRQCLRGFFLSSEEGQELFQGSFRVRSAVPARRYGIEGIKPVLQNKIGVCTRKVIVVIAFRGLGYHQCIRNTLTSHTGGNFKFRFPVPAAPCPGLHAASLRIKRNCHLNADRPHEIAGIYCHVLQLAFNISLQSNRAMALALFIQGLRILRDGEVVGCLQQAGLLQGIVQREPDKLLTVCPAVKGAKPISWTGIQIEILLFHFL